MYILIHQLAIIRQNRTYYSLVFDSHLIKTTRETQQTNKERVTSNANGSNKINLKIIGSNMTLPFDVMLPLKYNLNLRTILVLDDATADFCDLNSIIISY